VTRRLVGAVLLVAAPFLRAGAGAQPLETPLPEICLDPVPTGGPILLAQSGCCSFHSGVCGCSGGRTLCCDGTLSPTCTCTPTPPPHTLTITSGPTGAPNPTASGGVISLTVTAVDSLSHALSYGWSATCSGLPSSGAFNSATSRTPTWTAPENTTGAQRACTIQVVVADGQGLNRSGTYTQAVNAAPAPPPHTLSITAGPNGTPNPVASGSAANFSVTAVDSLGHPLIYAWTASCPGLLANGAFDNATSRVPTWTAPFSDSASDEDCTVRVTVSDSNGLSGVGSFTQAVTPVPRPSVTVVADACTTCHSGDTVAYHMAVTNPGAPLMVEVRGGARFPDGSVLPLMTTVTTVPTGASTLPLVPSQALPAALPTIDLLVEAALLEPVLGVTLSRHHVTLHLLP